MGTLFRQEIRQIREGSGKAHQEDLREGRTGSEERKSLWPTIFENRSQATLHREGTWLQREALCSQGPVQYHGKKAFGAKFSAFN